MSIIELDNIIPEETAEDIGQGCNGQNSSTCLTIVTRYKCWKGGISNKKSEQSVQDA